MVTVVDPNGTPAPVYTRSGTTIQEITANGLTQNDATQIVAVSGWTVVVVNTPDTSNNSVKLPDNALIGDLVEIHKAGASLEIFPAAGDSINSQPPNDPAAGRLFRKFTSTNWKAVGSP